MSKKPDESLQQYRDRVINSISPSFCAAKWYNATIWLGSGTTTSCHHPPAHKIPLEELKDNYTAIHNTKHKKEMRKMMLKGERPLECEYCWKIEDIGKDNVSDRTFKTIIYKDEDINDIAVMPWESNVNLKTLEISFDRVCNLACSYCNPSFSTTWARDIKKNGFYKNLVSDGAGAYKQDGSWVEPYPDEEQNPYIKAFWQWWENGLSTSLEQLRVTGGEPLMSPHTWKLLDLFESQQLDMKLAINSNLMAKKDIIDKFIDKANNIKNFHVYTSCEAVGEQAEYIRDGLVYTEWKNNMYRLINEVPNLKGFNIMMTINSLCLFSICDFFDDVYQMKLFKNSKNPTVSVNILRFPSFQSPLALPDHIKEYCHDKLKTWYDNNKHLPLWHEFELASIERLIDYLKVVESPHHKTSNKITLWRDFKTFYNQYDQRRGKNISVFPSILTDWIQMLPDTSTEDNEFNELAIKEGWILSPSSTNIENPKAKYD